MPRIGIVIDDEFISAEKAYMNPKDGVHLPKETVLELVEKYRLEGWYELPRGQSEFPYEYRVPFKGTEIYFISSDIAHFD